MYDLLTGLPNPTPHKQIDLSGVPDAPLLEPEPRDVWGEGTSKAEMLSALREQANATFFDEPPGVGRGLSLNALKVPGVPEFSYEVGVHIRPGAFKVSPAIEGRYSRVLVFRMEENGKREVIRTFEVDNGDVFVPSGMVLEIEATDTSAEATADAFQRGMEAASALRYGRWGFER